MLLVKSLVQALHHTQVAASCIRNETRRGHDLLQTHSSEHKVVLSSMWYSSWGLDLLCALYSDEKPLLESRWRIRELSLTSCILHNRDHGGTGTLPDLG